MTTPSAVPLSGYDIEKVYTNQAVLNVVGTPASVPIAGNLKFGWNWRALKPREFEVDFTVTVEPTPSRAERLVATVIGRFRATADSPSIALEQFVTSNALAILCPYAREILSSLSSKGFFGTYYLPPLNVDALARSFVLQESAGSRTLLADATLRSAFEPLGLGSLLGVAAEGVTAAATGVVDAAPADAAPLDTARNPSSP